MIYVRVSNQCRNHLDEIILPGVYKVLRLVHDGYEAWGNLIIPIDLTKESNHKEFCLQAFHGELEPEYIESAWKAACKQTIHSGENARFNAFLRIAKSFTT